MPTCRHSAAAASAPARGLTWSLPANIVGSLRIAVARIQATGPGLAAAATSSPMTTARAVRGGAGLVVPDRIPQHGGGLHLFQRNIGLLEVGIRVEGSVTPVLDRDHLRRYAQARRCA
jgi:hypothetical protein